jgi:hypothetical protein
MVPDYYIDPVDLELREGDVTLLSEYLDERRLLTTQVDVRAPAYRWVAIKAQLRATPGTPEDEVEALVLSRLYHYLNPLTGGNSGNGWTFGRDLFVSDVYQSLQGLPDVQFIRNVEMFEASPGGGAEGKPLETLEVLTHGVVASGIHEVEFV